MSYGMLPSGFVAPTFEELLADKRADIRSELGENFDVDNPPMGTLLRVLSERELSLWQAAEGIWMDAFPDTAEGTALDLIASADGVTRTPATKTAVTLTLTGTPATLVPAGSIVRDPDTLNRFVTTADATIGGGGTITVAAEAEDTGVVTAYAGTLTEIVTAVTGWSSVTNAADHTTLGADVETDAALRLRRARAVNLAAGANIDRIVAAVEAVAGVTEVRGFENSTDVEDDNGLAPHSVLVVVLGGADADIAEAIWEAKAAGIATNGAVTEAVTGADGNTHDVSFDRPSDVEVYVTVEVYRGGPSAWPSDGEDQVEAAVLEYGDALTIGADVIVRDIDQTIDVAGIRRTEIYVGLSASPGEQDDITIAPTERAVFDSARVVVTVVE